MFAEFWICLNTVHAIKNVLQAFSAVIGCESGFLLLLVASDLGTQIYPFTFLIHVMVVVSSLPATSGCRGSLS